MDIVDVYYKNACSLRKTAKALSVSPQKCRKLLIDCGVYQSERAQEIKNDFANGNSICEIAEKYDTSIKNILSYLPYIKGEYDRDSKTTRWRLKKQATDGSL